MDTPLISEAVSDIILILNFLAFFLVTFYFLLRSDRLYACLERREQSALGMIVGGFTCHGGFRHGNRVGNGNRPRAWRTLWLLPFAGQ